MTSPDRVEPDPRPIEHPFSGFRAALPAGHQHQLLLTRIKERLPELTELLAEISDEWCSEDLVYRFWHQSFKVYYLQGFTEKIVASLESLAPQDSDLHPWFREIVRTGTGLKFESAHNNAWTDHTRPMLEAFFHARFMLEMAVRYGRELETAPSLLPSGWAALLELYEIR